MSDTVNVPPAVLLSAAGHWLRDKGCEIVCTDGVVSKGHLKTWGRTLARLGADSVRMSVSPYTAPLRMGRTVFQHGNRVQVKSRALPRALAPFAESSPVVGVRLSRLSRGNTTVIPFVPADELTVRDARGLCERWIDAACRFQKLGRAPGQTVGEVSVGLYSLGALGFRIEQPVEVYPIFVYFDEAKFDAARERLLGDSVREQFLWRDSIGSFLLPKAPVFLQAVLVCVATETVAADHHARETQRAWRHYKKPKLAERVFGAGDLRALLSAPGLS